MLASLAIETAAPEAPSLGLDPRVFNAFYDDALPRIYGYFLCRVGGASTSAGRPDRPRQHGFRVSDARRSQTRRRHTR